MRVHGTCMTSCTFYNGILYVIELSSFPFSGVLWYASGNFTWSISKDRNEDLSTNKVSIEELKKNYFLSVLDRRNHKLSQYERST